LVDVNRGVKAFRMLRGRELLRDLQELSHLMVVSAVQESRPFTPQATRPSPSVLAARPEPGQVYGRFAERLRWRAARGRHRPAGTAFLDDD
jgi:hypothetical protein